MARDHARIHVDIWGDDDWLDVSVDAQLLYFTLYTSPSLSFCGSGEWHPGKLCTRASDWTLERVERARDELVNELFLIIDDNTQEYLIRSWIKHDGLWRTPNMAVSVANARAELASRKLRGVIVFEVSKLRDRDPESTAWTRPAVVKMLSQTAIDPAGLIRATPGANPGLNPTSNGAVNPGSNPAAKGYGHPGANPAANGGATTATAKATKDNYKRGTENRGAPLPQDWKPSEGVVQQMRTECPGVDLTSEHMKFVDHWKSQPGAKGRKADWDATWRNWIRRSHEFVSRTESRTGTTGNTEKAVNGWLNLDTTVGELNA